MGMTTVATPTSNPAVPPPCVMNATAPNARRIVLRTRGRQHGPIVRLMSPSDVGELIKPFIFLDHVDVSSPPGFGFHPHSGIATLTLLLEGDFSYEDSTGESGTISQGAVEWMRAGGGLWHQGSGIGQRIKGYQLWVALPPKLENSPAESQYLDKDQFSTHGPARVILGELGGVRGPIKAPSPMNYLDVNLQPGELWRYEPPPGHDVAWMAVHEGTALVPEAVGAGEMVVFEAGGTPIDFRAAGKTGFILGSAAKHPHELFMGHYSVHTTKRALEKGEANIRRIAAQLQLAGKL